MTHTLTEDADGHVWSRDVERRIPHDAADYLDGPPKLKYSKPFALEDGTEIDCNDNAFAETGGA